MIFKRAIEQKYINRPIDANSLKGTSHDDFIKEYREHSRFSDDPENPVWIDDTTPSYEMFSYEDVNKPVKTYDISYVIGSKGDTYFLPTHHHSHLSDIESRLGTSSKYTDAYEKIHHVFGGGLRVYLTSNAQELYEVYLYGMAVPNPNQILAFSSLLKNFEDHIKLVEIELRLKNTDISKNFFSYSESVNFLKELYAQTKLVDTEFHKNILKFRRPDYLEETKKNTLPTKQMFNKYSPEEVRQMLKSFGPDNRVREYQRTVGGSNKKPIFKRPK